MWGWNACAVVVPWIFTQLNAQDNVVRPIIYHQSLPIPDRGPWTRESASSGASAGAHLCSSWGSPTCAARLRGARSCAARAASWRAKCSGPERGSHGRSPAEPEPLRGRGGGGWHGWRTRCPGTPEGPLAAEGRKSRRRVKRGRRLDWTRAPSWWELCCPTLLC